ncbi:hypothetical protein DICPUDRAFT_37370 [Dictyostelium purpureum]|uniref:Uncharacterized protein n=1 Tax=Dictyostelium purpureum TaxID=5786 RepID=F0ZSS7_DICPU|nr:uncharacterized protein DICPUDRAFT_37370 [Dictyostelium purpureum]EGC32998.1 hypothetical protein DICPUDRAFT_37370 [Dictyostelium purpureum]|eukprot:XP_003290468.1 hypothetical protein DICPUDRAFT_37370 [Dictyostelium purpureum]
MEDNNDLESVRQHCIKVGAAKIEEMSKVQIQSCLDSLKDKANEITQLFDDCVPRIPTNNPPIYTLVTIFNLLINGELSTFGDSRNRCCKNGEVLLNEMRSFNVNNVSFHTFSLLRGYFENVQDNVLNTDFVFEEIEPYGDVAVDLYEWLDSNYTLLSLKYNDNDEDDEMM